MGLNNYSEEDYQYTATLDSNSSDDLTIDNIIGQIVDEDYSCRAGYTNSSGKFITSYQRGVYNDRLEIVNLKEINDTYSKDRNCLQARFENINPIANKIYEKTLDKHFFVTGFEYDVENNYYELKMLEVL